MYKKLTIELLNDFVNSLPENEKRHFTIEFHTQESFEAFDKAMKEQVKKMFPNIEEDESHSNID